ncbi:hypothetical protein [Nocardia sp. NBC_01009]|uniref:hypothetical protein n=1 Tax=Nocardia sp. NBC_01009 TaxID=2975996 RepID=UPI00386F6CF8|nr:hypothetical protein OHA42_04835 [Nocardia sp. NBC_01009]
MKDITCGFAPTWRLSPTEPSWIANVERAHGIETLHRKMHPDFECTRLKAALAYIDDVKRQASA